MELKKVKYSNIMDYVELESISEIKHEYECGLILAMSGGSINHGILCGNAYSELRQKLSNNNDDCKVFGSEIRIHIASADSIVYPDSMVICGKMEVSKKDKNAVTNPLLVVEVLSKSTAAYDQGDKFHKYRQLPSFREYVLINQDKSVVVIFSKNEEGKWDINRITSLEDSFELQSIGVEIAMQELYKNIEL